MYILIVFIGLLLSGHAAAYDWSDMEIISKESTSDAYRQCIAIDSNDTIHLIWKDNSNIQESGSDWDLYYSTKSKIDTWTSQVLITPNSSYNINCLSIAIDSMNMIHVAWKQQTDLLNDTDIFYMTGSTTKNWSTPMLISTNSSGICSCPSLFIDTTDTVHLIWADTTPMNHSGTDADLYYTKKTLSSNWSLIELVTPNSNGNAIDPFIVTDQSHHVHIVWYEKDNESGNSDIYYSTRSKSEPWSEPYRVSEDCIGTSSDPIIQIDSNNTIHVLWNDNSNLFDNGNDYDLFYRKKPNNGSWNDIELVNPTSHSNCKWPTMLVHENCVYVSWSDQTPYNQKDSDFDICFTKKENLNWSKAEIVSVDSIYESNWPRFVIDKTKKIHITWWDRTPSKWVIYYSESVSSEYLSNESSNLSILFFIIILLICVYFIKIRKK